MELQGFRALSEKELQHIHQATLTVLEEVGLEIQSEEALDIYRKGGASITSDSHRVSLPRAIVSQAIAQAPRTLTIYDRGQAPALHLEGRHVYGISGNGANYVLDIENGRRRQGTKQDVADFARLADALENVHAVAPQVVPGEVPGRAAPVNAFEAMLNNTKKPFYLTCQEPDIARAFFDLAGMVIQPSSLHEFPTIIIGSSPTSPLRWEKGAIETVIETAKEGIPLVPIPCPMAGVNSPITLAGTMVQMNAEVLSGFVLAQLVREGTPIIYGSPPTPFDMRQSTPVIGSPENVLMRIAGGQLANFYHLPALIQGWDSDAQCLDEQVAWEKMLTTAGVMDSHCQLMVNMGMLGTGLTVSFEQLVLDDEIFGSCLRLLRGIDVNEETLAIDVIREAGISGNFLGNKYTLNWLRREYWLPRLSNRATYETWSESGALDVVHLARKKAKDILANYKAPSLPNKIQAEMRQLVQEFEDALS